MLFLSVPILRFATPALVLMLFVIRGDAALAQLDVVTSGVDGRVLALGAVVLAHLDHVAVLPAVLVGPPHPHHEHGDQHEGELRRAIDREPLVLPGGDAAGRDVNDLQEEDADGQGEAGEEHHPHILEGLDQVVLLVLLDAGDGALEGQEGPEEHAGVDENAGQRHDHQEAALQCVAAPVGNQELPHATLDHE
eukprot:8898482-Alexandrium_andersonii.AAC.2